MKKFIIERDLSRLNMPSDRIRQAIAQLNCEIPVRCPSLSWVKSFITTEKSFCIFNSENVECEKVIAHGAFSEVQMREVDAIIDPFNQPGVWPIWTRIESWASSP
jgi:hypothetical protein